MDAVGADQHVGQNAGTIVEAGLDPVTLVFEADEAMAQVDALARQCFGDDVQQVGTVQRHVRRAVQLLAARVDWCPLQCASVLPAALMRRERPHAFAVEPGTQPEPLQDADRVRGHVDAAADFGQRGRLLVYIDGEAGLPQRQRGAQTADAAADYRDLKRHR